MDWRQLAGRYRVQSIMALWGVVQHIVTHKFCVVLSNLCRAAVLDGELRKALQV